MAKAGWHLKQMRAVMRDAQKPCPTCGHQMGDHRELRPTIDTFDAEAVTIVSTPNPDYTALVFHCHVDGCDCTIDRRNG